MELTYSNVAPQASFRSMLPCFNLCLDAPSGSDSLQIAPNLDRPESARDTDLVDHGPIFGSSVFALADRFKIKTGS